MFETLDGDDDDDAEDNVNNGRQSMGILYAHLVSLTAQVS